ncbi:MAG: hemerythrin domain-containing protein [Chitinophagaceae bacterium]|nr:hemerythrin domain-containing protein [Chitinophagaceae bacterium]
MESKELINKLDSFKSLTKEHEDGLLFCSRIGQGLRNHTSYDKLAKYVRWFWKYHIRPHFFQEEKILLPHLPGDHPFRDKLKNDHTEILELMHAIDRDAELFDLEMLAKFIEVHIQWEEKDLFPFFTKNLPAGQLAEIEKNLDNHDIDCKEDWKDEFWLSGITNPK